MDSECALPVDDKTVGTVFEADSFESSEDPPMDQWSSLEMVCEERNPKRILQDEGLYDPGDPEICTKYIALSASSVIRHVYYRYPAIPDPGILTALLKPEEPVIYADDGQELYLALCKQMRQCIVRSFHRGLLDKEIDLRYYCVNPNGVRAMAMALKYNKHVRKLNFIDNFLNTDAAYHLGDMLASNTTLVELNLSGCRLGPKGVQHLLATMITNRTLKELNLSKNEVGDDGMVHFASAIWKGLDIRKLDLSHNSISGKGVSLLVEPFQAYNKITHWNLSWNNLFSAGTSAFLIAISETTKDVIKVDLSWNGIGARTGFGIRKLLTVKALQYLDLSHNQLEGLGIKDLCAALSSAKNLKLLDLSYNPITPADGCRILKKLMMKKVKVNSVHMENVNVDTTFLNMLAEVMRVKPTLDLTYGYIKGTFKPVGPDYRELLFKRLEYLCKKPKNNKVDIALVLLQLKKDNISNMMTKEFYALMVRTNGAPVDPDLIEEIGNTWAGPKAGKGEKTINIDAMVEFCTRVFPERQLPPTPPPEPEPPPAPKGKDKGKKKGKK